MESDELGEKLEMASQQIRELMEKKKFALTEEGLEEFRKVLREAEKVAREKPKEWAEMVTGALKR